MQPRLQKDRCGTVRLTASRQCGTLARELSSGPSLADLGAGKEWLFSEQPLAQGGRKLRCTAMIGNHVVVANGSLLPIKSLSVKELGRYQQAVLGEITVELQVYEPYVDADTVARFLKLKRKTVLDWARKGILPTHPFGTGKRIVWRFLISEIATHARPVQRTILAGSPEIARLEKKCG